MEFYLWKLKELHLFVGGESHINPLDIALFLKKCPRVERLFIDVSYENNLKKKTPIFYTFSKMKCQIFLIDFLFFSPLFAARKICFCGQSILGKFWEEESCGIWRSISIPRICENKGLCSQGAACVVGQAILKKFPIFTKPRDC